MLVKTNLTKMKDPIGLGNPEVGVEINVIGSVLGAERVLGTGIEIGLVEEDKSQSVLFNSTDMVRSDTVCSNDEKKNSIRVQVTRTRISIFQ